MRIVRPLSRLAVVAVFAASGLVMAPSAHAASTLDQSAAATGSSIAIYDRESIGQSFTAGITGSLTSVDLTISNYNATADVTVRLYAANGADAPVGAALASAVVGPGAIQAFATTVNVPFSPAPAVVAGTKYVFTLWSPQVYGSNPSHFYTVYVSDGTYAGGAGVQCIPGTSVCSPWFSPVDLAFATYVDAATPAAPAASTALWTLDFVAEGGTCTTSSATQYDGGWLQLPKASDCTKPGFTLAGWVARQTDGPPAIEFAPGGWTVMTGSNHVYALWVPTK